MTEHEWLNSIDPIPMVDFLIRDKENIITKRKARLFALACWWESHHCYPESKKYAENWIDEGFPQEPLKKLPYTFKYSVFDKQPSREWIIFTNRKLSIIYSYLHVDDKKAEQTIKANILREIFGNPFKNTKNLSIYNTNTVSIALEIYDTKNYSSLPILHDALLDAGCMDQDVLQHCLDKEKHPPCSLGFECEHCNENKGWMPMRGKHVRGCWVLDLILNKE